MIATTERTRSLRCPACRSDISPGQQLARCSRGHAWVHAACRELIETCPIAGCAAPLARSQPRPRARLYARRLGLIPSALAATLALSWLARVDPERARLSRLQRALTEAFSEDAALRQSGRVALDAEQDLGLLLDGLSIQPLNSPAALLLARRVDALAAARMPDAPWRGLATALAERHPADASQRWPAIAERLPWGGWSSLAGACAALRSSDDAGRALTLASLEPGDEVVLLLPELLAAFRVSRERERQRIAALVNGTPRALPALLAALERLPKRDWQAFTPLFRSKAVLPEPSRLDAWRAFRAAPPQTRPALARLLVGALDGRALPHERSLAERLTRAQTREETLHSLMVEHEAHPRLGVLLLELVLDGDETSAMRAALVLKRMPLAPSALLLAAIEAARPTPRRDFLLKVYASNWTLSTWTRWYEGTTGWSRDPAAPHPCELLSGASADTAARVRAHCERALGEELDTATPRPVRRHLWYGSGSVY